MTESQTDNQIEEEHLLNFVVNTLDEELPIDLADGVKVSTETLYEVLAGASASGTSVNQICEETEDSPHANTVRGHLPDQFDLDTVEQVGARCSNRIPSRRSLIDRRRSSPTSTSIPTTVMKMRQNPSIPHWLSVE